MRTVLTLPLLCWLLVNGSVAVAQEDPGNQTPTTVPKTPVPEPQTPPARDEKKTARITDGGTVVYGEVEVITTEGSPGSSGSNPKPKPKPEDPAVSPPPPIIYYWYLDERAEGDCRYSSTVAYGNFALGVLLTYAGGTQFRTLADFGAYVNAPGVSPGPSPSRPQLP